MCRCRECTRLLGGWDEARMTSSYQFRNYGPHQEVLLFKIYHYRVKQLTLLPPPPPPRPQPNFLKILFIQNVTSYARHPLCEAIVNCVALFRTGEDWRDLPLGTESLVFDAVGQSLKNSFLSKLTQCTIFHFVRLHITDLRCLRGERLNRNFRSILCCCTRLEHAKGRKIQKQVTNKKTNPLFISNYCKRSFDLNCQI